jgi:CoA:oxalate CoA-transferase
LGAEIIKIEDPSGDEMRMLSSQVTFACINRNKKGMTLNLKSDKGKEVFYDLVKKSDVVYDNYRAGVVERLGIDYDTLKKINPRIICCSVTGFGRKGPYTDRPCYDLIVQAMGGAMSITGEPGRPPVRMGIPMGDLGGGMFAAHGIMAALYSRERTGVGQQIDVSLLNGQISLLMYMVGRYFDTGIPQGPVGSGGASSGGPPENPVYRGFETKNGWLVLAAGSDKFWGNVCKAIGKPELAKDPRFESRNKRRENWQQVYDILEEAFAQKTKEEWWEILVEADVPSGIVNTIDKAVADPAILEHNMIVSVQHPEMGEVKMAGNPIKFSGTPAETFRPSPTQGQHTEEILSGLLAYPPEKIEELKKDNII